MALSEVPGTWQDATHRIPQLVKGEMCIVLSFFSGVEVAALAVHQLIGPPLLHISWETDEHCQQVITQHYPSAVQRGDLLAEDPRQIIHLIERHDPHQAAMILFLSAPPCPDFSQIKEDPAGFSGAEGSKFTAYVKLASEIEEGLGSRQVRHLTENVVLQQKPEVDYISSKLRASPIVLDATDFGATSRPRLWWTRLDWSEHTANPLQGGDLRWGKHQGFPRLFYEGPVDDLGQYQTWGYSFSSQVRGGQARMPCLTTPAPDEKGRPAPKRAKQRMSDEVRNRWLQAGRQYAPWHYEEAALMEDPDGEWVIPPIWVKEQLHHMPVNYTQVGDIPLRARHKMLGNSWHLGVVKFLLLFILQWQTADAIPVPPRTSSMKFMIGHINFTRPMLGPGSWSTQRFVMEPTDDMASHWMVSQQCLHPQLQDPVLEPGLQNTVDVIHRLFGDIPRLRAEVVEEIRDVIFNYEDITTEWWAGLSTHVREVYDHREDQNITQVPVLLHLLHECGYPGLQDMSMDLNEGFDILGPQHPGVGWQPRLDGRYATPLDIDTFLKVNKDHITSRIKSRHVDKHWEVMLDEILADRDKGKISGPYRAPLDWPFPSVSVKGLPLLPLPEGPMGVAMSFSVEQADKIRRCEDYRRSYHNSTIRAGDSPHHHSIEGYAELSRYWAQRCGSSLTWAHDLDAAYRQIPVKNPQMAFVALVTPMGPTLWRHNALCFGATASVWSFNRLADALTYLGRCLLASPVMHFVDDFGSCEPEQLAKSTFHAFAEMTALLGLKMKDKKANPPSQDLKMLGVFISCDTEAVTLRPCPQRLDKILKNVQLILEQNYLGSDQAQRLCGKLVFLQTTSFGKVGQAALHSLYSRASELSGCHGALTHALRASLMTLLSLLRDMKPRILPVHPHHPSGVIYTDAFFSPGDDGPRLKPNDAPLKWHPQMVQHVDHGWGSVTTFQGRTAYSFGKAPTTLLKKYGKRKAFIYFLELLAPVVLIASSHRYLPRFLVAFIDNQAGLMALTKGYGGDPAVNGMLTFFWALLSALNLHLHFEWVPSSLNIADPISRRDFSIAHRLNWHRVDLELEGVYVILHRCADNLQYASGQAVQDCLRLPSTSPWLQSLELGGESVPEVVGEEGTGNKVPLISTIGSESNSTHSPGVKRSRSGLQR